MPVYYDVLYCVVMYYAVPCIMLYARVYSGVH